MINRGKIDETLAAMFSNPKYSSNYLFYAHMIGQCSIKLASDLPAPAGVAYIHDHYNLYINPTGTKVPFEDIHLHVKDPTKIDKEFVFELDGEKFYWTVRPFDDFTLVNRLAILKHEMQHILYDHVGRKEDRDHKIFNIASDCALNQQADLEHLPECAILPKNLSKSLEVPVPSNKSAEFYYDLIRQVQKDNNSGDDSGKGKGDKLKKLQEALDKMQNSMDSHETWEESVGSEELKKDITKKMIQKAQGETVKSKGNLPSNFADWLELHTRKAEVNWRQVLRRITGNKKVGKRSTIMRKNRRFPNRPDLRGTTKDRTFEVLIVADVSGSMSAPAISSGVSEVKHICDVTQSDANLIQIDSQASEPEKINANTKIFTRKSSGGTYLFPAIEKAREHNLDFQAIVVITDGYLFGDDISQFAALKKKIIWLIEENGQIMPEMNSGLMQAFQLKPSDK